MFFNCCKLKQRNKKLKETKRIINQWNRLCGMIQWGEISGFVFTFFCCCYFVLFCFFCLFLLLKVFLDNVFCGQISLGNAGLNKISCISLLQSCSVSKEGYYGNLFGHWPCGVDTFYILQCGRLQKVTADSSHHCTFALFALQYCSSYHKRDEVKFSILWICTWPCNLLWLIANRILAIMMQSGLEPLGLAFSCCSLKPWISYAKKTVLVSWRMRDDVEQKWALLAEIPSFQPPRQLSNMWQIPC